VQRCTRERIIINTFMLERSPWLTSFRRADGAHQPRPRVLRDAGPAGEYLVVDYVSARRRRGEREDGRLKIWLNGKVVPGEQAVLPSTAPRSSTRRTASRGCAPTGTPTTARCTGFRLAEHFARLRESMKMMRFSVPYSDVDLYEACAR